MQPLCMLLRERFSVLTTAPIPHQPSTLEPINHLTLLMQCKTHTHIHPDLLLIKATHFIDSKIENVAEALQALGGAKVVLNTAPSSAAAGACVDGTIFSNPYIRIVNGRRFCSSSYC